MPAPRLSNPSPILVHSVVHFPNLDGWRTVAFLLVFTNHGFSSVATHINWEVMPQWLEIAFQRFFLLGDVGVSFFFVLSGFLITYLIISEIERFGRLDVMRFYARRTLRIWPLYFVVVCFALVGYPTLKATFGFAPSVDYGQAWYYWTFLSNFDVIKIGFGRGAGMTNITWSVAIEEQFYLIWPILFAFVPHRLYGWIFPAVILQSIVFRFLHIEDVMVHYFHTLSVAGDLALGGAAGYLLIRRPRLFKIIRIMPSWLIAFFYMVGVALVLYHDLWSCGYVMSVFDRLILCCFFAFIIIEQNVASHSPFKMATFDWLSRLGKFTYGLYLLHPIAITGCLATRRILGLEGSRLYLDLASVFFALGGSIAMAYLSYHFLERPFLRLKDRFRPRYELSLVGHQRVTEDERSETPIR